MPCKICGNTSGNHSHIAREMMFGYRDEFTYIECVTCGCLQITEIPSNLEKYYPSHYYSLNKTSKENRGLREKLMTWLEKKLFNIERG